MSEPVDTNIPAGPAFSSTLRHDSSPNGVLVGDFGLPVILALPWLLLAVGNNWIFDYVFGQSYVDRSPYIDPWFYLGFFLDLRNHMQMFPATYYGSRLSWILPGYLVYRVFPPLVAAYVLHFGVYYVAVFALYFTLKHTIGPRAALLGAVLMGSYGYFLWAAGWDYVDGAGIAYFLLTTMALTFAVTRERSWFWLILGGAFYGAMIYSQLFLLVFTAPLLLYFIAVNREDRRISKASAIFLFTAGLLAISVLLGAINRTLGGDFLFFVPSIKVSAGLVGKPNPWKLTSLTLWKRATWLVLPVYASLCSMAVLFVAWKSREHRKTRSKMIFQLYFLGCLLIMVAFELKGSPVLEYSYYASFLIPAAFLALGAQFAALTDRMTQRHFVLTLCAAIFIPLLGYRLSPSSRIPYWVSSHAWWLVLALFLIGVSLFVGRGRARATALFFLVCIALGTLNIANDYFRAADPAITRYAFSSIVESLRAISSLEPGGKVLFWYRLTENMGIYYRSVASTYLWGYSLVNERFPSMPQRGDSFQPLVSNAHLVLLSQDTDAVQQANSVLSQEGLGAQLIANTRIDEGKLSWMLFLTKLHAWPVIQDVSLTEAEWPENIQLRFDTSAQKVVSLTGPAVLQLFRSDMNNVSEWEVNRYGLSGGLSIQPDCLATGDRCGMYSSGSRLDHLASPFASLPDAKPAQIFFSVWAKPLRSGVIPEIFVQNEAFATVAEADRLLTRNDGWVLYGDRFDVRDAKRLRLVVRQPLGAPLLLDKALLLEIPEVR